MMNQIDQVSAIFAITVFIIFIATKYYKKQPMSLSDIVISVIAGGMLPVAFAFIIYPFYPQYVISIESMSLQITITGLVLVFVYLRTIWDRIVNTS